MGLDAFEVAGADHRQDRSTRVGLGGLAQLRRHVAVALGDQRQKQVFAVVGKLGEGGLEYVAFLEVLDVLLADLLARHQAGDQAAEQHAAAPPAEVARRALQGGADLAVDQHHLQIVNPRLFDRHAHLGARLDAELFTEPLLIGRHRQVGHDHRGLALTQHLHQVEFGQALRVGQCLVAAGAQFDRDRLVGLAVEFAGDLFGAAARDMRGAQQGDDGVAKADFAQQ